MGTDLSTPTEQGFAMPAEWEPHAGCLMAWPSREELWRGQLEAAASDYATVARAIASHEPVVMVCSPGHAGDVRDRCGPGVMPLEIPINDSWARDSGPAFVRHPDGEIAVVGFGFNAWGNRWHPHDDDAALSQRIATWLGLRFFRAPLVLEGGSFFVDGEGTVITTEQCLLNPNRNPNLTKNQIADLLCSHLGANNVIWLPYGHSLDIGPTGTDGHIDGVLQFVAPGRVLLEMVGDPSSPEFERGRANLAALKSTPDARGRELSVEILDPGPSATVSFANHYLANGAVIVPVGAEHNEGPLERLGEVYPGREIVAVPGEIIADGGGGPHCITQQIPEGVAIPW